MRYILLVTIKHPVGSVLRCSRTLEIGQQTQIHTTPRGSGWALWRAAALRHSLKQSWQDVCVLGSNASCLSYFWPCFGLQRREVRAPVSLLSSLFEGKPNKRGPALITSVLPFLGPPKLGPSVHMSTLPYMGSCMPLSSG